jgi:hypothetical protein
MQNTEYADFNWEKCTLHVQPKSWRKLRLKGKSKKKSAKDRFIPIPAKLVWMGTLCCRSGAAPVPVGLADGLTASGKVVSLPSLSRWHSL